jgi:hypothetical protein
MWYNMFMLYLWAKSFSHQLQLLVKLRLKEVYMFYVFLTITQRNFNGVYYNFVYPTHYNTCLEETYRVSNSV